MSTTTITMSAGTWYKDRDNVNHSSDTWLKSTWEVTNRRDEFVQFNTVLQFSIPSNLKYKRIKKVQLSFYSKSIWNGYEENTRGYDGIIIRPYNADGQALYSLTGQNINNYGELGEPVTIVPYTEWASITYPAWRTCDVTSIFVLLHLSCRRLGRTPPTGQARQTRQVR